MKLHLELITPERVVYRQEVDKITLPTTLGEITILPNHIPLVATLVPGVASVTHDSIEEDVAVSGGFIVVQEGNKVNILADSAERGEDLNLETIEAAKARAEKLMTETVRVDASSYANAAAELERELARYKVAVKHRKTQKNPTIDSSSLPHDQNPV
jgi:F-type H+-transporting ATPase subunit epsilon